METKLVFVIGPHKSSTSTLVGILNCHPNVFLLYETDLTKSAITKYGLQLLANLPQARRFFHSSRDMERNYRSFAAFLQNETGREYAYVGDKIVTLDLHKFEGVEARLIFPIRDLRTWLAKDTIVRYYKTNTDAVPAAIDFVQFAIKARGFPNGLAIAMEDVIENNEATIETIGQFLELDLQPHTLRWWNKVGLYPRGDPKAFQTWQKGHVSSTRPPEKLDTAVKLKNHPFWQAILPVFDRYYRPSGPVSKTQIGKDMRFLDAVRSKFSASLEELYEDYASERSLQNKRVFGIRLRRIRNSARKLRSIVSRPA